MPVELLLYFKIKRQSSTNNSLEFVYGHKYNVGIIEQWLEIKEFCLQIIINVDRKSGRVRDVSEEIELKARLGEDELCSVEVVFAIAAYE